MSTTKEPYQIEVNGGQHTFQFQPADLSNLDLVPKGDGKFHLLHHGVAYHAELESADYNTRNFVFRIEGLHYTVHVADHYERLVQRLGLHVGGPQKQNTVKAPMPGLVLSILVEAGQPVQKGDALLILEAMKMENVLKAAGDGTVKAVKVQKGAAVDKGQLLIEMEEQ
jgi:biotin carboxyl carrier protein